MKLATLQERVQPLAERDDTGGKVVLVTLGMKADFSNTALLIVGHGSTVNPDSSAPSYQHAAAIRRRGLFAEVECCFWKEEPSMRDARFFFQNDAIREVSVVPNFISQGYFTQTVIPRELGLTGPITERANGQIWKYCPPAGNHPMMTELLLRRAREVAPGVPESETSLLIVGHGTDLNDNSALAAKREVEKVRALGRYAAVLNVYMEEPPLVAEWAKLTETPNVVVVPFFVSDGLHSFEDIPELLRIGKCAPDPAGGYAVDGRTIFYARAIGTDARFADVIVEQARSFESEEAMV